MNGKGDKRRPGNGYSSGWDKIYKEKKVRRGQLMKYLLFAWEIFKVLAVIGFAFFILKLAGIT